MYSSDDTGSVPISRPEILSLDSDFSSSTGTGPLASPKQNEELLIGKKPLSISNLSSWESSSSTNDNPTTSDSCCTLPIARAKKTEFYHNRDEINDIICRYTKQIPTTRESKHGEQTSMTSHHKLPPNVNNFPNVHCATAMTTLFSEDMDMKYAEMTHRQLTLSLNQLQDHCSVSKLDPASTYAMNKVLNDSHLRRPQAADAKTSRCVKFDYSNLHSSKADCSSPCYSKLAQILKIKDEMLQEKETTIVRLRLQISSLQHQAQETEAVLHQEQKTYELEQALGKTENQLFELETQSKREKKEMEKTIRKLQSIVKQKEQTCSDLKKKSKVVLDKLDKYTSRVESLERYLADLPTIEETDDLHFKADHLVKEKENLSVEISVYKSKLDKKSKLVAEKSTEIALLQEDIEDKIETIKNLQRKLIKSEKSKEKLGPLEKDELEDLREEVSRLKQGKNNASRLIAGSERRAAQLQAKHNKEIAKLKEKIHEAEDVVGGVRKELEVKQKTINEVNSVLKNMELEYQQLLDEKLSLQDKVKNLEDFNNNTGEVTRVYSALQQEASSAAQDLRGITQVLIETSRGADPNISALLGVRSDSSGWEEEFVDTDMGSNPCIDSCDFVEQANKRLMDVRQLRKDIRELRSSLANHYAVSIGSNCTTQ